MKTFHESKIHFLNQTDFYTVNEGRTNLPPVKITVILILLAVIITSLLALAVFYFPLTTISACSLSFVIFKLFVKPRHLTFFEEEYSPDYHIGDH
jgi:hypothetical protein